MEDSEIIILFFERSEQAISELSKKYGGMCRRVAYNILKSDDDAAECVNDALLGAWNSIPPARPDPLGTYVCRITRNLSLKRARDNGAKKRRGEYGVSFDELEDCVPAPDDVGAELDGKELADAINVFLDKLDHESRVMFVRRYWFMDPVKRIAETFHISEKHATTKLYRTKLKLREFLSKKGFI